jgi:spermidine dehydrogenase
MSEWSDRELGMDRPITRRDFLNGLAIGIGGATIGRLSGRSLFAQSTSSEYPPALTGLRGSTDGSFETAHSLRDGTFWRTAGAATDTRETYDLVVVGGGISGLAAGYFFRERFGVAARILILENHDDFGGHARRNEFTIGGRTLLMNGGTASINSPTAYSREADGLLKALGVEPEKLNASTVDRETYRTLGLRSAVFFDKETFGADRLVLNAGGSRTWSQFVAGHSASRAGSARHRSPAGREDRLRDGRLRTS